jgi:hypothetical protein
MTDLVERLRDEHTRILDLWEERRQAATALEAKDKELAALRWKNECLATDLDDEKSRHSQTAKLMRDHVAEALARAETAERELSREREAFQRHEQTLRDNGINSHSEAVVLVDMLRRERDEARAALKPFAQIGARWPKTCENDNAEIVVTVASLLAAARSITGEKP